MVSEFELVTKGGFDVGRVVVEGAEMTFWNEYMTLERGNERLYTFQILLCPLTGLRDAYNYCRD